MYNPFISAREIPRENLQMPEVNEDGLKYIAGWIAYKFRKDHPELGTNTARIPQSQDHSYNVPSWIQHLSFGGLIVPNEDFFKVILYMEKIVKKQMGDQLPKGKNIVTDLTEKISKKIGRKDLFLIDNKVVKKFVKMRIIIRMRYLNQIKEEENLKKRKIFSSKNKKSRKMAKIIK